MPTKVILFCDTRIIYIRKLYDISWSMLLYREFGYLCNEIQHFSDMVKITVQKTQITVLQWAEQDYISLTDMASAKDGDSRSADI